MPPIPPNLGEPETTIESNWMMDPFPMFDLHWESLKFHHLQPDSEFQETPGTYAFKYPKMQTMKGFPNHKQVVEYVPGVWFGVFLD